jgi:hypothetical protein
MACGVQGRKQGLDKGQDQEEELHVLLGIQQVEELPESVVASLDYAGFGYDVGYLVHPPSCPRPLFPIYNRMQRFQNQILIKYSVFIFPVRSLTQLVFPR